MGIIQARLQDRRHLHPEKKLITNLISINGKPSAYMSTMKTKNEGEKMTTKQTVHAIGAILRAAGSK